MSTPNRRQKKEKLALTALICQVLMHKHLDAVYDYLFLVKNWVCLPVCQHLTWIDSQAIGKNFVGPRDTNSLLFSVSRSPNHTLIMKVQMPVSPAEDTALEMSQTQSHCYDQMIRLCFCLLILAHAKSKSCIKTMGTCKIAQTLPKQTKWQLNSIPTH